MTCPWHFPSKASLLFFLLISEFSFIAGKTAIPSGFLAGRCLLVFLFVFEAEVHHVSLAGLNSYLSCPNLPGLGIHMCTLFLDKKGVSPVWWCVLMPLPISVLKRLRQKDRDMGLRHTMLSSPAALFLGFLFFLGEMGELPVYLLGRFKCAAHAIRRSHHCM